MLLTWIYASLKWRHQVLCFTLYERQAMQILSQHIPFVKEQIGYYDRMAVKFRTQSDKQKVYIEVAVKLRALLGDMESDQSQTISTSHISKDYSSISAKLPANFFSNPLALAPADYAGLEKDLLSELNITENDKLESTIVDLINAAGGVLVLDKIIVGIFHITGEKHQRISMTAKLYRMAKKNLVYSVPKKKGVYTTTKPTSDTETFDDVMGEGSAS